MSIVLSRRTFLAAGAAFALAACGVVGPEPVATETPTPAEQAEEEAVDTMNIEANRVTLPVALASNEATRELVAILEDGPVTLSLAAYGGFEKVGPLGFSLPTSDERITTQAGDIMLYQGNQLTVFTGPNTWSYTRIGHLEGIDADELSDLLGEGDVSVKLTKNS